MTNQVLAGEGVGWLRVGRLKKLFEDESYRVMAVAKLNRTLDRKIGPDDHIDDVCITKPIWKGMVKMLQLLIGGLEHSSANRGLGGMASAFQVFLNVTTDSCGRYKSFPKFPVQHILIAT